MSNFFEMGSSHIQPAWESNNNNKKVEEGRGLGTAAPVREVQARGGGTAAASGNVGWTRPEGEGGRQGRCSRYLCGPRPGSDPRARAGGSFPQLFRKALRGARRGSALAARCYAGTQWGSRHVFFNSRQKSERGRRGAGQVNACGPFRTRGCGDQGPAQTKASVGREGSLGHP